MPPKIYEIKVFRNERETREINPFLASIDLSNSDGSAETTAGTLNRHLLGAALRSGASRNQVHQFHLEVRDIDRDGKGAGRVLFRWVVPASEDV